MPGKENLTGKRPLARRRPSVYMGGGGARKAFIDCSILRLLDSSIVRFIDSFVRRRENTRRKTGRTRTGRNTRVPPSRVSQDAARRFRMPESMSVAHIVVGIIPKFRISRQKRRARSECELTCQKKHKNTPLRRETQIWYNIRRFPFGRGAVVAQLTVNQLVAGSNPAARANGKSVSPPKNQG